MTTAYPEQRQIHEATRQIMLLVNESYNTKAPVSRRHVEDIQRELGGIIALAQRIEDRAYENGKMEQRVL